MHGEFKLQEFNHLKTSLRVHSSVRNEEKGMSEKHKYQLMSKNTISVHIKKLYSGFVL